ncbi:hypothetical protein [uncultured Metabacillus sp.]|uniref:hypothetical protein n=1 Tax=uncultured Metabacillus sp. TaxID=2860135 RepID=UPI0026398625|nr:hypothetical protein [uncultured Metabacillus sp.]
MIIFDEKKYAETMIKKGFQTKNKIVYELNILAKYYFYKDLNDDEVKSKIIKFCEKYIEHFNLDEWFQIINRTVFAAKRGKFITGKVVNITQKELDVIDTLEDIREKKVVFVLLVLYKFYDYKKFEVVIEDLYRLSKLNINSKTKLKILQSLTSKELIDITMGGKRWVKYSDKKGKPVITIKDFDDFVYEYELYVGTENFKKCEVCEKAIKGNSKSSTNAKKYCRKCAEENTKKNKRMWKNRSRKS